MADGSSVYERVVFSVSDVSGFWSELYIVQLCGRKKAILRHFIAKRTMKLVGIAQIA